MSVYMHIPRNMIPQQACHTCEKQLAPPSTDACSSLSKNILHIRPICWAGYSVCSCFLTFYTSSESLHSQWHVIPPQISQDTNKMRSSEVKTICGGKLWCVSRAYLIKDHLPTHFLGNPQRMAAANLKKKKKCAWWRRQKGLFLRKSTI